MEEEEDCLKAEHAAANIMGEKEDEDDGVNSLDEMEMAHVAELRERFAIARAYRERSGGTSGRHFLVLFVAA